MGSTDKDKGRELANNYRFVKSKRESEAWWEEIEIVDNATEVVKIVEWANKE